MSDDFRVRVTLHSHGEVERLAERLARGEAAELVARSGPADRVAVSVNDRDLFLYSDTRSQADAAAGAVAAAARSAGFADPAVEVRRWHPTAEEWEDPDLPLPDTDAARAAEHAEAIARERAESESWGVPEYEVRVHCSTHRATVELDERLRSEGLPSVRRWRYLLVGAADEDAAQTLADRLTAEVPPGSTVSVEATIATVERETPFNPFAVFGGLGG